MTEPKAEAPKAEAPKVEAQEKHPEPETKEGRKKLAIGEIITVKELGRSLNVTATDLIKGLMKNGVMATLNQSIDFDTAAMIADQFGFDVEIESSVSDEFDSEIEENPEDLRPRSPIVTIMGHVDHGKTTLLDSIRKAKVADGEFGGITQHIGAYEVEVENGTVIFLDTPGHEAFTAMRARGAQVTDIVILVVAADDGVMPQTTEAVHHARAAEVPIVVAVNKMDKPDANPDRIKQELSNMDPSLTPEEWGGTTIYVNISAKENTGISDLLEMLLLQAEMLELKASPKGVTRGTIIEAQLDKGRGPVATLLTQRGTLKVGQPFIVGTHFGKVRALINSLGKKVSEAGPSTPVEVLGLNGVPQSGDTFMVVESERKARHISIIRSQKHREAGLRGDGKRVTLEELHSQMTKGAIKELNLIVKADVQGSVQAIQESLSKVGNEDVRINMLHGSVGGVTENDIMLASASNAVIIAFNIEPSDTAVEMALVEKIEIKKYTVIYNVISDIKLALEGLLEPNEIEKIVGKAEVKEVFNTPKVGTIAGCYVNNGFIKKNLNVKLVRDSVIVYHGKISSLRRFKDDVREVQSGYECGIGLERFNDIKIGDIIEPFLVEKVARTLD
ncbi:MAG: translation initiation factor IF-2 [Nitrospinota bacterium]